MDTVEIFARPDNKISGRAGDVFLPRTCFSLTWGWKGPSRLRRIRRWRSGWLPAETAPPKTNRPGWAASVSVAANKHKTQCEHSQADPALEQMKFKQSPLSVMRLLSGRPQSHRTENYPASVWARPRPAGGIWEKTDVSILGWRTLAIAEDERGLFHIRGVAVGWDCFVFPRTSEPLVNLCFTCTS